MKLLKGGLVTGIGGLVGDGYQHGTYQWKDNREAGEDELSRTAVLGEDQ